MRPGQKASEATRAKLRAAQNRPEVITQRRAAAAVYWTPERREAARQAAKAHAALPHVAAKVRANTAAAMARPEVRAKQIAGLKRAFSEPALVEKMREVGLRTMADPAKRARFDENSRRARERPDHGRKIARGVADAYEADHCAVELGRLTSAWESARESVRRQFLRLIFGPLWAAPVVSASAIIDRPGGQDG